MGNATILASLCRLVEWLTKLTLPAPARCVKVLLAMVPLPPLPPLVGREDNTLSTNTNGSLTELVRAVCRALKAHAPSDRPLPAGRAGGKDSKGNSGNNSGNSGGSSQELDHAPDWDGPPPPPKQQHDGNKGDRQVKAKATMRAMATVTRIVREDKCSCNIIFRPSWQQGSSASV